MAPLCDFMIGADRYRIEIQQDYTAFQINNQHLVRFPRKWEADLPMYTLVECLWNGDEYLFEYRLLPPDFPGKAE